MRGGVSMAAVSIATAGVQASPVDQVKAARTLSAPGARRMLGIDKLQSSNVIFFISLRPRLVYKGRHDAKDSDEADRSGARQAVGGA